MQQGVFCALMLCPDAVSVPQAVTAMPGAGRPAQQGMLQGFGGMNAPRRLRLIAAARNALKNIFTLYLYVRDLAAVKIKHMGEYAIFRNIPVSRSRQTRAIASFMRPSAWCMNASRRVIAPACSFPSYDMEIYGNPS